MTEKLSQLRQAMVQAKVDYYYIPATDAHNDEYVPPCWQRRAWISGFDGSAGDVLVGAEQAYLWTDARYFLQAEQQLDADHFCLMRQQQGMKAPIAQWLKHHAAGKRCGVDPRLLSVAQAQRWQAALASVQGELVALDQNLVDLVWSDQPQSACQPIRLQALEYTGDSAQQKIAKLRQSLAEQPCDAHVLTVLDAIAWLFNIRGHDIAYNPLVISYALITADSATLFLDLEQVTAEQHTYFEKQGVTLAAYRQFQAQLSTLTGSVLLEGSSASWWVAQQLVQAEVVLGASPVTLMKACKNAAELRGMVTAHQRDAAVMVKFLHWLDHHWQGQSELSVAQRLDEMRLQDPHCLELSFPTIVGFAAHGAIIHYRVTPETDQPINDQALFLIDSGGQYDSGTTDITRTVHLGQPSAAEKRHYTLVLKGHLALRHVCFPQGSAGVHIDVLAHQYLWQAGLDYAHGTGHGVGSALCCHEGPQRISQAMVAVALQPGMVVSNEPGVYFADQYGIRVENLCVIVERYTAEQSATGHGPFYGLDDLTMVPHARNLIALELLTAQEIDWINAYHAQVFELLAAEMDQDQLRWLKAATLPL